MILVALPHKEEQFGEQGRRLVFYLAMEEYIAANLSRIAGPATPPGEPLEAFFLWQVQPTVIFGRNQVMEAEVNLPYCRSHGVQLYRRKSGGGCVYADEGNLMLSCMTGSTEVAFTFDKFLSRLALALRRLGLNASRSGRNDVLIDGRKVSGNAFFLLPAGSIVHGTLLYDSDFEAMERALTPSDAKVRSKGIASVRQHVVNIHELAPQLQAGDLKKHLITFFCSGRVVLTADDVAAIERIEATYLAPEFIAGKNHRYSIERRGQVEGAGEFRVEMEMEGEAIVSVSVSGDYFPLRGGDFGAFLTSKLRGVENSAQALREALKDARIESWVMNLSTEEFLKILI